MSIDQRIVIKFENYLKTTNDNSDRILECYSIMKKIIPTYKPPYFSSRSWNTHPKYYNNGIDPRNAPYFREHYNASCISTNEYKNDAESPTKKMKTTSESKLFLTRIKNSDCSNKREGTD